MPGRAAQTATTTASAPARKNAPTLETDEPWLAPSEAAESGFMEEPVDLPPTGAANDAAQLPDTGTALPQEITIGTWVNLLVEDQWERTQLSWIGSHGTLFLFTNAYGHTQSMTRRVLDKRVARGALRVISGQTVVEGALDAVARTALRNSLGTGH